MMETRLIPKKFLKLIKNLADENRNYKKIFGNVFWLEVVKEKNYSWFNLRLNSNFVVRIVSEKGYRMDFKEKCIKNIKKYGMWFTNVIFLLMYRSFWSFFVLWYYVYNIRY